MRLRNKQSGFTLTELIIIIAIVAVFAAIATPNFLSYLPKSRLNGAARQVMGDLMAARMKAVSLNHRVKVFFYSNHQYKICDDANNNGTVTDGEGDVQLKDIHSNYHDVTISFKDDLIKNPIFSPKGTASNRKNIKLTNSSGSKYIKIAITGRVKIDDTP